MPKPKPTLEDKKKKHVIPYDNWINSQLSVARHFGGCTINGKSYIVDFDNAPQKIVDGEVKYFPNLVEQ
jgi:hypothetical protein